MKPTYKELEDKKDLWKILTIVFIIASIVSLILLFFPSLQFQYRQLQSQLSEAQNQLSLFQSGKFSCHNFSINQEGIIKDAYGNCLYDCYSANIHINLTRCEVLK